MWYVDSEDSSDNLDSPGNLRDRQMGENLIWLVENRFPGRKVIVWAATFHIARNIQSVELLDWPGAYDGVETMGQVTGDTLGDQIYSVGFTACEGEAGTIYNPPRELEPFLDSSLEDLLYQTGL